MGFDVKISVKKDLHAYDLVEYLRVHGKFKEWLGQFGNSTEVELNRKQVSEMLSLIFESEIEYFDSETTPCEWHLCFTIPQFMAKGFKVFIENSF